MPKSSKRTAAPEPPAAPQVGDKVKPGASEMVYEVSRVSPDGVEVDLHVPGMNLQRFRVRTDTLSFVERKPPARTSNPFTNPEPAIDVGEVLERVRTAERENLQRLKDDIAILKAYLKTQGAPKATISALEGLTIDQHKSWKTAVERIEELLEE
jgi:hypothetical protein